jgi:FkbM family methyltransferase
LQRNSFIEALHQKMAENICKKYGQDNWDQQVLGDPPPDKMHSSINKFLAKIGLPKRYFSQLGPVYESIKSEFSAGLNNLYEMLADNESKRILVEVMAYRIMGYRHIWLSGNTLDYWKMRENASRLPHDDRGFTPPISNKPTSFYDLRGLALPIIAYGYPPSLTHSFLSLHYDYDSHESAIRVSEGDYVIDAGACWGDTSLLFAHKTGPSGKVFAFEFEPQNLTILHESLGLNCELSKRISVVQKALWSESGKIMSFEASGPGTMVASDNLMQNDCLQIESIRIDDFCKDISKVDFIKMDIEGAELPALRGAEETLRKFKPKLAISLYHSLSDFVTIPEFLQSLDLNYKFYLKHPTIFDRETVLFAEHVS